MSELPESTPLIKPIELSDGTSQGSSGNLTLIVDRSNNNRVFPGVDDFPIGNQIKEKVREFVSHDPGRAALAAMATGAVLTGLLRYLIKRKKSSHHDRLMQ